MQYKASLDTFTKTTTAVVFLMFVVLGAISIKNIAAAQGDNTTILTHIGLLLLYVAILVGCYLFAPKAYRLEDQELVIVRPAFNKVIKLEDIVEARPVTDLHIAGTIRTFGVGGFFGWYGQYYAYKAGSMTFYASQQKNKVLIRTRQGRKIIITPDDTSLSEKLVKQPLTPLMRACSSY